MTKFQDEALFDDERHMTETEPTHEELWDICPKCKGISLEWGEDFCRCHNPSCGYEDYEKHDEPDRIINSSSHGMVLVNAIGEWA